MSDLFYHRCRVTTFKVQCAAHKKIVDIKNSKLRASSYKLYRWMCSYTSRTPTFSAKLKEISKVTGISQEAIINARRELQRINLIQANKEGGPGGRYQFTLLNAKDCLFPLDWNSKPWPHYFSVPSASMLSAIYPDKWTGTDALIYDALSERMGRTGDNKLPLTSHWFKEVSKNTLSESEECLERTGFIHVKGSGRDRVIEILNPETSDSMPAKGADQEPMERAYYIDPDTKARRLFNEESLTPEAFETYFRKSLPRGEEWSPRQNAYCPFHNDNNASLSINVDTGQFKCFAGCTQGNKLVTFEMRLLDTDDVQEAWSSVAKKIGFKPCLRSRGKMTHEHFYRDEKGEIRYRVRRYEDGSASYSHYAGSGYSGPLYKPGLNGTKRLLYNLPEVIAADIVLFVEGEKKADILTKLRMSDSNGKPVAVTTTGGADSWRIDHVEHFKGKRVVLLPDTDEPGLRYSEAVQAGLRRAEIEYRLVDFDGYGNDFRDYLTQHGAVGLLRFIECDWLMSAEEREREEAPIEI
jgi:putative DNA primase/helicase